MPKQNETTFDLRPIGAVGSGLSLVVDLGTLRSFVKQIQTKLSGGWAAYTARPYATSVFGFAVAEALTTWNTTNAAAVTSGLTALGTSTAAVTASFPNPVGDPYHSFEVLSKLGCGLVDALPVVLFRSAQHSVSPDADLAAALGAWT